MVALCVDDGLMVATYQEDIDVFLDRMSKSFVLPVTRCPVTNFLGVQVVKNEDGSIFINQELYTTKILDRFNMSSAKSVSVPIEYDTSDSNSYLDDSVPYQAAVGSLLYLSNGTRPDITFAVNSAARSMQSPKVSDWNKIKHVLRYLVGTVGWGILYQSAQSPGQLDIYRMLISLEILKPDAQQQAIHHYTAVVQSRGQISCKALCPCQQQRLSLWQLVRLSGKRSS